MTTIFLSHSSQDKEAASQLKAWLEAEERGHHVFLDDDLYTGIKGGEDWEQALYEQLRICRVFLPLFTQNWVDSKWCFAEMTHARASGKLILPVKLDSSFDTSKLFSDLQQTPVDLSESDQSGYQRLQRSLQEEFPWNDPKRSPYPGLLAFQEDEAAIYRGRGPEITNAIEILEGLRRRGRSAPHFVLLLGASGSGKSSLVRAGIIPRLRLKGGWLPLSPFMPRSAPISELAEALSRAFKDTGSLRSFDSLQRTLAKAAEATPPDGEALLSLVRELRIENQSQDDATLLLVIDQAEELFAVSSQQQAEYLLGLLRAAIEQSDGRLMVLATMRSEFLGSFQAQPFLIDPRYPELFTYENIPLDPLPTDRFREIIQDPAALTGLVVDEDLVERMVADTGTRDALPLLAYTLRQLWDNEDYRKDGRFELREYQALGGLDGSIRKAADEALDVSRRSSAELEALRGAFVPAMVGLTHEDAPVRRRARRDELPAGANDALEPFVKNRLLITDYDPEGRETIEVAHEALLRVWPQLVNWLNEDRGKLLLLDSAHRAAQEWHDRDYKPDLLAHRGDRLKELIELVRDSRFQLQEGSNERQYLNACEKAQHALERKEKEEQERKLLVFKRWLAIVFILLLLALMTTWHAFDQEKIAKEQTRIAEEQTKFATEQARHAKARAAQAEASLLWSNLVFEDGEISLEETDTLWQLAAADEMVRDAFAAQMLDSEVLSERFVGKAREITRALVALDSKYRQNIIKSQLVSHGAASEKNINPLSAVFLTVELETIESINFQIGGIQEPYQLTAFIDGLLAISGKLTDTQVKQIAEKLVQTFPEENILSSHDFDKLARLLTALANKLTGTQAKLVAEILMQEIQDTKDSYLRAQAFGEGLAAVANKLTNAQAESLTKFILQAIQETTDGYKLSALGRGLTAAIVANKLTDAQAESLTKFILQAIQETTDGYKLSALGRNLTAAIVAVKLTNAQAELFVKSIPQVIKETKDEIRSAELGKSLAVAADKLTNIQAESLAKSILLTMQETTNNHQLSALGMGLVAASNKLTDSQIKSLAKSMLKAIKETAGKTQLLLALGQSLIAVVGKFAGPQPKELVDQLLKSIQEAKDPTLAVALGEGLEVIEDKLTDSQSELVTEILVQGMEKTTGIHQHKALVKSLAATPGKLTDTQVKLVAKTLVQSDQYATRYFQPGPLNLGLTVIADKLTEFQVKLVAEILVQSIHETGDFDEVVTLDKGFATVLGKLTAPHAKLVAERLVQAILEAKTSDQTMALVNGLAVVPGKLTDTQARKVAGVWVRTTLGENDYKKISRIFSKFADKLTDIQANQVAEILMQALLETNIVQGVEKPKNLSQYKALVRGLAAVPGKLTDAQAKLVIEILAQAIQETMDYGSKALGDGLEVVMEKLTDLQAELVTEILVQGIVKTINPNQHKALIRGFAAVLDKLTDSHAKLVAEMLVQAILKAKTSDQHKELVRGFATVVGKLTDSDAKLVAERLVQAILEAKTSDQTMALVNGLAVVPGKLTDTQARKVAGVWVRTTLEENDYKKISRIFSKFADKLTDIQANQVAEILMQALLETKESSQIINLGKGLAEVPDKLTDLQATLVTEMLVQVFQEVKDSAQIKALSEDLEAIPGKLTDIQAKLIAEILVQAILEAKSSQVTALVNGLSAVVTKFTDSQVKLLAVMLVRAIQEEKDPAQVMALGEGLGVVVEKLTDIQAELIVEMLLQATLEANSAVHFFVLQDGWVGASWRSKFTDPHQQMIADALGQVIAKSTYMAAEAETILDQLSEIYLASLYEFIIYAINKLTPRERKFAVAFDVLKNPILPKGLEKALLEILRAQLVDALPENQGLWSLVESAQKEFPGLDFSSRAYAKRALKNRLGHNTSMP